MTQRLCYIRNIGFRLSSPRFVGIGDIADVQAQTDVRVCAGFRMPAMQEKPSARCPASESRQRTNPRAMVRGVAARPAMGILLTRRVHTTERNASGREQ